MGSTALVEAAKSIRDWSIKGMTAEEHDSFLAPPADGSAIGQSVSAVKAAGSPSVQGRKLLSTYTKQVDRLKAQTDALDKLLSHESASAEKQAKYMRDQVVPAMAKLRETGDKIEVLTPHKTWPMPTYREMLFVK